jgi:uncharacterized membrane protein
MNQVLSTKSISEQKKILYVILGGSIVSFLFLTYQTYLFYVEGSCGCTGNATFTEYSKIWGIPISLIGMFGVGLTIGVTFYFLSKYALNSTFSEKYNVKIVRFWYFYQLIALLFVFNMMYIVYFLAQSFCELCTVSQIVGILNFILVFKFFKSVN